MPVTAAGETDSQRLRHICCPAHFRPSFGSSTCRRMETEGQNLFAFREGAKLNKTQQPLGKKKTKKKKKKGAQDGAEKKPSKSKKPPAFLASPELRSGARTEDATKEAAGRTTRRFFASTSSCSLLTEGQFGQSNESLRWNGILDDPVAEEERLWHYRLNRRKRYDAYIHQNLPPEPSLTLRHLPQLCQDPHLSGDLSLCRTEPSRDSPQNSKT